jgi:DNA helicase II / ATP-dependent DNA helicase PcrA
MATERFSLEDFKNEFPELTPIGMVGSEYCFELMLRHGSKLHIRSSIGRDGFADSAGEDSIRILLLDKDAQFIVGKEALPDSFNYISRVKGWNIRLRKRIEQFLGLYSQVKVCKVCGKVLRIRRVKNPTSRAFGKLFQGCSVYAHENGWNEVVENNEVAINTYMNDPHNSVAPSAQYFEKPVAVKAKIDKTVIDNIISKLDEDQRLVITNKGKGPSVVDAGAGSGKTTTMVALVASMIADGVDPSKILAVTFTTKAAAEMRIRIAKAIWPEISERELAFFGNPKQDQDDDPFSDLQKFNREWVEADPIRKFLADWVCTIHAMSFRLLKAAGFKLNVLSGPPHEYMVKNIIRDGLDEFKWSQSLKSVQAYIDSAIDDQISEEYNYAEAYFYRKLSSYSDVREDAPEILATIYKRYMSYMKTHNLVSFSMMQARVIELMGKDPAFAEKIASMFEYVIVDEGQDTDDKQIKILFFLARIFGNITMIGDVWQSLYKFRGAKPSVLEEDFVRAWANNKRFFMGTNYRSSKIIVANSTRMIANNYIGREQYLKDAHARDDAPDGDPIEYEAYETFSGLTNGIVTRLLESQKFDHWAILSRTRAECASIHMDLIKARIPAVNLSGGLLFGAPHVRKVLAYAKLVCNYQNARNDLDTLKEIANVASSEFLAPMSRRSHIDGCENTSPFKDCGCPVIIREGVDRSCVRYYAAKSIEAARNWKGIIAQMSEKTYNGQPSLASKGAADLVNFVTGLEDFADDALACINSIIGESVLPWLMHEEGIGEGDDLAENGKQEDFDVLRNMTKEGQTLEQFLEDVDALAMGQTKSEEGAVHIATVHKYKGLEIPFVILNTTRMPIQPPRRKEGELPVGVPNSIEDERNIAYVGATRAKEKLVIVQAHEWLGKKTPTSPFVEELGIELKRELEEQAKEELEDELE